MSKPAYDQTEAERFLKLLDPDASFFTFQTFGDREGKGLVRVLHGTLAKHWGALVRLNERGAGIFVTVNATDGKGRKAANIVRVRCLYIDLDGNPLPQHGPPPHIIVETSPGRWHVYWRVTGVALDDFTDKQRALIAAHGSDRAVCALPHVMRLPGFLHRKRRPVPVRIISTSDAPTYKTDDFPKAQVVRRRSEASDELTADEHRVVAATAFIPNEDIDWKDWCDLGLAIFAATSGSEMGFAIFDAWSQKAGKYNARFTEKSWEGFARSPPDRIGAGTIFYLAGKACPEWADLLDDDDPAANAILAEFVEMMGWRP